MKAARLYGPRMLRVEEVPKPEVLPGEVLVRVESVGICGSDVHYYVDGRIGDTVVEQPIVLGHEVAGVVEATGPGVTSLRVGQRVAVDPSIPCGQCEFCLKGHPNLCPTQRFGGTPPTDGAFQEFMAWPASLVYALPDSIDATQGALLEPLGVAIHALDLGKIHLADRVAVLGAGPVGLLVAKAARLSGAVEVFATDIKPTRLEMARAYGADAAIDAANEDPVAVIRRLTKGRGVDVAFECAGAMETPQQAVDVLRPGGTIVIVGINSEDQIPLKHTAARRKGVTIKLCRRVKHVYTRAIDLVAHGLVNLTPLATHRYSLADTALAFEALARGDPDVVKAMVDP